jgi:hypothetical protein
VRLVVVLLGSLVLSPFAAAGGGEEGLFPPAGCVYNEFSPNPGHGLLSLLFLAEDPLGYLASVPARLEPAGACFEEPRLTA